MSEHYEVLSEHYFLSENYSKAAEYSKLAAGGLKRRLRLMMRLPMLKKRVTSLERLPQTEDVEKQIIDARTVLGLYIAQMNYLFEAKEAIDPIIDLAIKHDYKRRLSQIYVVLGAYYFVGRRLPRCI